MMEKRSEIPGGDDSATKATRPPLSAIAGVFVAVAIAVALSTSVISDLDTDLEGPATYVPVLAAVWLPAILGIIGLRHPAVLLAGATACFPLSMLSLAGATLPLLVPAFLYLVAYGSITTRRSGTSAYVIAVLGLVLGLSALIPLFGGHTKTVCSKTIRYPDGHKETVSVSPSQAGRLGSLADGAQAIASECREGPAPLAGALSLAVATAGVLLIVFLGRPRPGAHDARPA